VSEIIVRRGALDAGARVEDREPSWLPAARQGETWALEALFQEYQPQVYALCCRLLGTADDAHDATQSAFIKVFRELPRFRRDSSLRTWIYRIAVNEAIDLLRRRKRAASYDPTLFEIREAERSPVERMAVWEILARLKPHHRVVLTLRFWEGLSYEELAAVLNISLSAVKMRLKRAKEEFRSCYDPES
jgi:RNA polymerase sigma-70 factor, ECF subfamily